MFRSEAQDRDAKILQLFELKLLPPEEALKELSYKTGNKFIIERMESMAHANELLEAAKIGYDIEIFRTDNLEVFIEVFGSYMRQSDYYALPLERQNYIRDIYVALEFPDQSLQESGVAPAADRVFPKDIMGPDPGAALTEIVGQSSPSAQLQQVRAGGEQERLSSTFAQAEQQLAKGSEALIGSKGGY